MLLNETFMTGTIMTCAKGMSLLTELFFNFIGSG